MKRRQKILSKSSVSNWTKLDRKLATLCTLLEIGKSDTSKIRRNAGNYCKQGKSIDHNDELEILRELKDEQIVLLEFKERGKLNPQNLWWPVDIETLKEHVKDIIENPIIKPCLNISLEKVREVL
jgi:hypothetical protein